jgi:hypothetical protein
MSVPIVSETAIMAAKKMLGFDRRERHRPQDAVPVPRSPHDADQPPAVPHLESFQITRVTLRRLGMSVPIVSETAIMAAKKIH